MVHDFDRAVLGAAMGCNISLMESLLSRGADINYAVRGAAMGGHDSLVNKLMERTGANYDYALLGYLISGRQTPYRVIITKKNNINLLLKGLAFVGDEILIKQLLTDGADINYALVGAGLAKKKELLDTLLALPKANINFAISGAAQAGDEELFEYFLSKNKTSNLAPAINGAALGGHIDLMEKLLSPNRSNIEMKQAIVGATKGRHKVLLQRLLECSHVEVLKEMLPWIGQNFLDTEPDRKIAFLSFFKPDLIPALWSGTDFLEDFLEIDFNRPGFFGSMFNAKYEPRRIEELAHDDPILSCPSREHQKKAIAISEYIHINGFNYSQSLVITSSQCTNIMPLLMMVVMQDASNCPGAPYFPLELWAKIFSFITPAPLNVQDVQNIAFNNARTLLCNKLASYQSEKEGFHKVRAKSFFNAIALATNKEELQTLIHAQAELLQGKNTYAPNDRENKYKQSCSSRQIDRFHKIIGFWEKTLTGNKANFIEPESSEKCVIQ